MNSDFNIVVLGSGKGSNLGAIIEAIRTGKLKATISAVMSDKPLSGFVLKAQIESLPVEIIDPKSTEHLLERIQFFAPKLIVLAGYMRILPARIVDAFAGRIINIHPSLLPQYPGLNAWQRAFADNISTAGCTVHFVDNGMDTGQIIEQSVIFRKLDDTAETFFSRIQIAEHALYPSVIQKFVDGVIGNT